MRGSKSSGSGKAVVVIAAVIMLFVGAWFFGYGPKSTTTTVINDANGQQVPISSGCSQNPSLTSAIVDSASTGTSVTPTNYYRLVSASPPTYQANTSPTILGTYDILMTSAGYVSKIHSGLHLGCGANVLTDSLYAYANDTITVYSNSGLTALTNAAIGGLYNETVAAAGGSYTWKYHLVGTNLKATGPQMLVVEMALSANVSSVSFSCGQPIAAIPKGHSSQIAGGYITAFALPSLTGNTVEDCYLTASATSGKLLSGPVYTTLYSMQPFVETDGTFNEGTSPFDSLGTAKYQTYQTYNWFIKA